MTRAARAAASLLAAFAPAGAMAQGAAGPDDAATAWTWVWAIWAFVVLLAIVRLLFGPGRRGRPGPPQRW
jgi:hypothetical protein